MQALQVFLIGGSDIDGNHLATVSAYDAVLEESFNYTDMPQPRAHAAVATDNTTIYVCPCLSAEPAMGLTLQRCVKGP